MLIAEPLLILAVALCKSSVLAFPSSAGSCNSGNNALAGSDHLLGGNTIKTGSLATGSYAVTLGGSVLTPNVVSTFPTNTNTNLVITGTKAFKGFLVRLGKVGEVNSLTPVGTNMQVSSICTSSNVGGVTHTNSNSKTSITTTLKVTGVASSMPLDITIVVQNSNGLSEYYYSQFLLSSTSPVVTKVPTTAPVTTKVPTNAPVTTKVPTNAPVTNKVPTNAPVTTKVPANAPKPTKVPTNAPVGPTAVTPVITTKAPKKKGRKHHKKTDVFDDPSGPDDDDETPLSSGPN